MRILVADDDAISAKILSRVLEMAGNEVTVAYDGWEALRILEQPDAPPLAILDWMMPRIDGPDVCRLLRRDTPHVMRYLILLTSRDSREDVVEGLQAGANDYLVKPFHQPELLARVTVGSRVLELQQGLAARVEELQVALSQVKQLSGLLPICSYCKSVRSDENYWQQVDGYLAQHSDARVTHGICPRCFEAASKELANYGQEGLPDRLSI